MFESTTIDEKIFGFAYGMAFRDATMRNAFVRKDNCGNKESDEEFSARKRKIKNKCRDAVKCYIKDILDGRNYSPIEVIRDVSMSVAEFGFTFGNTQKLVNMTAKYFYLSCFLNEELKERFKDCDCPMDGIMITRIRDELGDKASIKADIAWSRVGEAEYEAFQTDVRTISKELNVNPVELDYLFWDE